MSKMSELAIEINEKLNSADVTAAVDQLVELYGFPRAYAATLVDNVIELYGVEKELLYYEIL